MKMYYHLPGPKEELNEEECKGGHELNIKMLQDHVQINTMLYASPDPLYSTGVPSCPVGAFVIRHHSKSHYGRKH